MGCGAKRPVLDLHPEVRYRGTRQIARSWCMRVPSARKAPNTAYPPLSHRDYLGFGTVPRYERVECSAPALAAEAGSALDEEEKSV